MARLRTARTLSQAELAELVGISQQSIAKIEQGKLYRAAERLAAATTEAGVIEAGVESAREFATSLRRTESLNTSPTFIAMLEDLVRRIV